MQFRLSTLFLLFVVFGSTIVVFGSGGIIIFIIIVLTALSIVQPRWLLALLGFLLLMALLLPAISCAREAARRMMCANQIKQIALALHNYRDSNGCFPPTCITDRNGKPLHSWRVLILPYLEEQSLYKQYSLNEPWDGPNNKKLLASRPRGYACASDRNAWPQGTCTSYAAVVGANAAWSRDKPGNVIEDSQTIMLVEVSDANIQWSEPRDVSLDALVAKSPGCVTPSSKHFPEHEFFTYSTRAGINVILADGSARFLPGGLLESRRFPELLKVGGFREEYLDTDWSDVGRHIHWPNCAAFAVWLASSGWLLVRAVRSRKSDAGRRPSPSLSPEQRSGDEENETPLSRPNGPTVPLRDAADTP
jgi:hypothetical protein